ncbi:hypothetical protein E2C01_028782 [Portunus trituberculatus]|uniref:Uncharacterized protein n=1 Tax=Portunus trituberculatus TaxID=210409 RepID=A0A5B7ELD2_PORTR|nr:hypothetical protein [Portunus trituberculatus]
MCAKVQPEVFLGSKSRARNGRRRGGSGRFSVAPSALIRLGPRFPPPTLPYPPCHAAIHSSEMEGGDKEARVILKCHSFMHDTFHSQEGDPPIKYEMLIK